MAGDGLKEFPSDMCTLRDPFLDEWNTFVDELTRTVRTARGKGERYCCISLHGSDAFMKKASEKLANTFDEVAYTNPMTEMYIKIRKGDYCRVDNPQCAIKFTIQIMK